MELEESALQILDGSCCCCSFLKNLEILLDLFTIGENVHYFKSIHNCVYRFEINLLSLWSFQASFRSKKDEEASISNEETVFFFAIFSLGLKSNSDSSFSFLICWITFFFSSWN